MKSRLVRIGNSRGVRLRKPLIEEAGLGDEVEIRVREGPSSSAHAVSPGAGWAESARQMRERGDDRLLDDVSTTRFDEEEWRWR
jgi:antitoxin MazE